MKLYSLITYIKNNIFQYLIKKILENGKWYEKI
jgi:hypothetical protein